MLSNAPTVFRAELRAVVHAVMRIACPFVVRTDCKGVYKLCKAIFEGKEYDRKHNDADLLNQIAMIHAQNPLERVIEWMPAHLDDPKNAAKRAKFLANGGTEEHINGNCGADTLAGAGALRYPVPALKSFLAQQRKRLTMTTQDMMCSIWMRYIDDNTTNGELATANDIDISDIQELDHCDEEGSESEVDPLVDFNGNEISRAPRILIPNVKDNDTII